MVELDPAQIKAIEQLRNGYILCGGVGSGKSRTALAYYFKENGGDPGYLSGHLLPMNDNVQDLYIITTARKRDDAEWLSEAALFRIGSDIYKSKVVVDSWNNIGKYAGIAGAFFIFDEQRVVGHGPWVNAFLKITKANNWILLSATPGDKWEDYIPVFMANGFFKTRSEFYRNHAVFSPWVKYRKIDRYLNTRRLERLRDGILVDIEVYRHTVQHHEDIFVDYDKALYLSILRDRWDIWKNEPLQNAAEVCYALRRVVNQDITRQQEVIRLVLEHDRVIIFYNYDYELEILRNLDYGEYYEVAEWNGHKHQPIPQCGKWVYLVQYIAGAEGWNCIATDTIIFYSQSYSYKSMVQAAGRIDRLNTRYVDLYYYHLRSRAGIDLAINRALKSKKKFNETKFMSYFDKKKN